MNYLADHETAAKPGNSFIPGYDWLAIILFALFGSLINYFPYNHNLSYILQGLLLGGIFIIYRSRPVMMIVAYILLTLLPNRADRGFSDVVQGIYTLNPQICIVFTLLFLVYGLVILKQSYRVRLPILFFVILLIASLTWTISMKTYTNDLWLMCAAYVFWPMFIQEDNDVRLVLIAYVGAVDVFCIKVLPMLVQSSALYRAWINLDPNYAAFYILISVAIVMVILMQYRSAVSRSLKIFLLGSTVLSILTMAYFASRTSFVMLAFLVIVYLLYNLKRVKTLVLSIVGIISLYLILDTYGVFNAVLLRFGDSTASTGGGRAGLQQALLGSIYNFDIFHFSFGNGFLTANYFGIGDQAHNSYISILISIGLVGLVIYGVYLYEIFIALESSRYKPFLIIFFLLCLYGFSLEPYQMIEGILFYCLLSGIGNLNPQSRVLENEQMAGLEMLPKKGEEYEYVQR